MSLLTKLRRRLSPNRRRRSRARNERVRDGRHEFLTGLHRRFEPRTYLEVGVRSGSSLALSHVPSIAIDPAFKVTEEIRADVHLIRATSDDLFARPDPLAHLRGRTGSVTDDGSPVIDLAFIDGMHLFEFALRDFMNVERFTTPASIVVFDDMLPRNVPEAARDRVTSAWTGDVYKIVDVLRHHRPDLTVVRVNTPPTGLVVVFGPDATNNVLREHYDDILAKAIVPDPQPVPEAVLTRSDAVDPTALLASGVWAALVGARDRAHSQDEIQGVVSSELATLGAERVAVPA